MSGKNSQILPSSFFFFFCMFSARKAGSKVFFYVLLHGHGDTSAGNWNSSHSCWLFSVANIKYLWREFKCGLHLGRVGVCVRVCVCVCLCLCKVTIFRHKDCVERWNVQLLLLLFINPLTPNDLYSGRTAPLTSKRCILYIYSTNIQWRYSPTGSWPTERPPPVSEASANFCG